MFYDTTPRAPRFGNATRSRFLAFGGCFCTLLVLLLLGATLPAPLAAAEPLQDSARYTVRLEHREFVPETGDYAAALDYMSRRSDVGRAHILVQMNEIPTEDTRASLALDGLELHGYLPERTYYAKVSAQLTAQDLNSLGVRWAAPLAMEDKVSVRVREGRYASWADYEGGRKIYAIQFHRDVTQLEADAVLSVVSPALGGWINSIQTRIAALDPADVATVAALDEVKYVSQLPPVMEDLNDQMRQAMSVPPLNQAPYNLNGAGSTVLVYDGGMGNLDHNDFGLRMEWGEFGGISDHATHTAGTVGGSGSNSGGTYKGVAPECALISFEYESCSPYCLYNSPQDIEENYTSGLYDYGADLATNSIGSNIAANGYDCDWQGDYETTAQLVDAIAGGSLGVPFLSVWAAGNERAYGRCGTTYYTTGIPATAKNSIVAGATNSNNHSMTYFSSWGPVDDGRIRPDVCAPGCQEGGDGGITSTSQNGQYSTKCGTSMATPAVSGCIALFLEQWGMTPGGMPIKPRPATVKAVVINTAQDYGNTGPDYQFGFGEIRPVAMVDHLIDAQLTREGFISQGVERTYSIEVPEDLDELKVTLAWDDVPGEYLAAVALVNDLDLTLESPSGQFHQPWILNPASPSTPATRGTDRINPVENVLVDNPEAGTWVIHVDGYQIPEGPQSFSVAANARMALPTTDTPEEEAAYFTALSGLRGEPNPFTAQTTIRFRLEAGAPVDLQIYDSNGRRVRSLLNGQALPAGRQGYVWDGRDDSGRELSSGVYHYKVTAGEEVGAGKLLLVK